MHWFGNFVVSAFLVSLVVAVVIFYISSARPILHASCLRVFFHFATHDGRVTPLASWDSKRIVVALIALACIGTLANGNSAAPAAETTNVMSDRAITQQLVGSWTARGDSPEFLSRPNMQSQLGIAIIERLANNGLGSIGAYSNSTCQPIRPPYYFSWFVRNGRLVTSRPGKHVTEDLILRITSNFLALYSVDHQYKEYRIRTKKCEPNMPHNGR
jgi:hypothetical protein